MLPGARVLALCVLLCLLGREGRKGAPDRRGGLLTTSLQTQCYLIYMYETFTLHR